MLTETTSRSDMDKKFNIRTIPGKKIGKGTEYQDRIVQIKTEGWVAIRFSELYDLAIEIGVNEERLHPQPRYRGYTMMMDEFNSQVKQGIEKKLADGAFYE
tara:strand:+ start:591 stop:893 length:303 start_codon:yes stop_codon:yes gene_type:complete